MAAQEPYVESLSFDFWSAQKWVLNEDTSIIPKFDFESQIITAPTILYGHFLTPTISINGFIKTNANGVIDCSTNANGLSEHGGQNPEYRSCSH